MQLVLLIYVKCRGDAILDSIQYFLRRYGSHILVVSAINACVRSYVFAKLAKQEVGKRLLVAYRLRPCSYWQSYVDRSAAAQFYAKVKCVLKSYYRAKYAITASGASSVHIGKVVPGQISRACECAILAMQLVL